MDHNQAATLGAYNRRERARHLQESTPEQLRAELERRGEAAAAEATEAAVDGLDLCRRLLAGEEDLHGLVEDLRGRVIAILETESPKSTPPGTVDTLEPAPSPPATTRRRSEPA